MAYTIPLPKQLMYGLWRIKQHTGVAIASQVRIAVMAYLDEGNTFKRASWLIEPGSLRNKEGEQNGQD